MSFYKEYEITSEDGNVKSTYYEPNGDGRDDCGHMEKELYFYTYQDGSEAVNVYKILETVDGGENWFWGGKTVEKRINVTTTNDAGVVIENGEKIYVNQTFDVINRESFQYHDYGVNKFLVERSAIQYTSLQISENFEEDGWVRILYNYNNGVSWGNYDFFYVNIKDWKNPYYPKSSEEYEGVEWIDAEREGDVDVYEVENLSVNGLTYRWKAGGKTYSYNKPDANHYVKFIINNIVLCLPNQSTQPLMQYPDIFVGAYSGYSTVRGKMVWMGSYEMDMTEGDFYFDYWDREVLFVDKERFIPEVTRTTELHIGDENSPCGKADVRDTGEYICEEA